MVFAGGRAHDATVSSIVHAASVAGAWASAAAHLALIVFLVCGGALAVARPGLRRAHLACVVGTAAVFLAGADCPFTVAENRFRGAAGWARYDTGFVAHYLVRPLTGHERIGTTLGIAIALAWTIPTVVTYGPVGLRKRQR